MNRRQFLATAAGAGLAAAQPRTERPNFVVIYCDDLGYGDLGCYGHPTIRTPNLDRMAAEGMKFTQFYSASSVCSPSRAALLTGRYSIRSGVTQVFWPYSNDGLPVSEITIAQGLKTAGYRTACVGKWHLGHRKPFLPTSRGFDRYFGIPYSNDMGKESAPTAAFRAQFPPTPIYRDERVIEEGPDQTQITRRYTEESIAFLKESRNQPFFLYLAHSMPHTPIFASERFRGKSPRGLYGDVVEEIDWSVGEILRTLRELGLEQKTLVMFSSDNGPWLLRELEGGSAGSLRGGKNSTWEGGFREPGIFRWPGRIPAGVTTNAFATTMDLLPTFFNLAGVDTPKDRELDGADIRDVLLKNGPGREPLMFYWAAAGLHAVRKGPWKLRSAPEEYAELYQLDRDPSEKFNVARDNEPIVAELSDLLARHRAAVKVGRPDRVDPATGLLIQN
jgi:arylsulfatase